MQKLMKRTAQAVKQAERKKAKKLRAEAVNLRTQRFMEQRQMLDELNYDVQASRLARREKWDLGPLAPRRDILENWGALETNRQNPSTPLKLAEVNQRSSWASSDVDSHGRPIKGHFVNLAVKDRVVLLEGPEKGKIDHIASIDYDMGTVQLENIGKATLAVPEAFREALGAPATQNAAMNFPISAVRLVYPLIDPETGVAQDTIINELVRGPVVFQDTAKGTRRSWSRYIPGANIHIPWPKQDAATREIYDADTRPATVKRVTFVPSLLRPPMPASVIDELRNKYSRFRTRHEDEYIARKEEEEEHKKALKQPTDSAMAQVRTPLQEFNRQQREARRARGKPELTDEMLEKIGEVIARNKARTLNAAGISEVSSASAPEIVDGAVPSEAATTTPPPPQ